MDFKSEFKRKIEDFEKIIDRYIPSEEEYPNIIFKAMRYSVFAGGKRIRPILLMSACELFGGDLKKAEPFASAIEMIHTYSLIHDDLPAMDNDDYRRGRLTSHKVFGEDIAILTGDALLHHSMETMANACLEFRGVESIKAMQIISNSSGVYGMLSGQVVDIISEGKEIDGKTLEYIHRNKTSALISASLKAGASIGGASDKDIEIMGEIGEKIGIAFQIQDDILDVTSTTEILGKPVGSDEKNNKVTYVSMYGLEKSKRDVERLSNEAISMLEVFGEKSEFLLELTKYLIKRSN